MGCYVNPQQQSKEDWLLLNGSPTVGPCAITETHLPVVLVNNGQFTAAGVAFDARERECFNDPSDVRLKRWFMVERSKLRAVSDLARYE
jgi:hypothetical protein